jgi:hypothetical protein
MACGEGSAVIACPPRAVLELVLDVERYRLADRKIGRVHWVHRHGNHGQVKHDGRLLGLPFPPIVLAFTLTPWSRLDFGIVTAPWPLTGFEGSFTCEPTAQGTRVVHRECFTVHPLVRPLDPVFGAWLARDTPQEVGRIKRLLEREPRPER